MHSIKEVKADSWVEERFLVLNMLMKSENTMWFSEFSVKLPEKVKGLII
jgi:hypothetical protein